MDATFDVILPLVAIASIGYFCAAKKFLSAEQLAGISRWIFYLCIPALLFTNMAQATLHESFDVRLLASFYLPVIAVFTACAAIAFALNKTLASSGVIALGASYSNTVLIGLPIVVGLMGKSAAPMVFAIIIFHSAMLFLCTYLLASKEADMPWQSVGKQLIINPIVLPISVGIVVNLLSVPLPSSVISSLNLLAEPAIAGALFILGSNLYFYRVRTTLSTAILISAVKLILLPALVYIVARYAFALTREQVQLLVLLSASPLGVNAYLVAKQLKTHSDTLASTVVISTVLSVFTFAFWMHFLS